MDNAFNVSSEKIIRALSEAEVMSIFFTRLGKALIVDTRHDLQHGPLVLLDDMVASPEERLRSIQRMRPEMQEIGYLTLAPWYGTTATFAAEGILEAIVERFRTMGYHDEADEARSLFHTLRRYERETERDLVIGNPRTTRPLWTRKT